MTLTWIIMFTNLLPISMMVQLEIIKLIQAIFMGYDDYMIEPLVKRDGKIEEVDIPMRAQSSNLNEELGQVEYIFSDKTGTLTANVMEFRKFSAGKQAFGSDDVPQGIKQEPNVNFYDPKVEQTLRDNETT